MGMCNLKKDQQNPPKPQGDLMNKSEGNISFNPDQKQNQQSNEIIEIKDKEISNEKELNKKQDNPIQLQDDQQLDRPQIKKENQIEPSQGDHPQENHQQIPQNHHQQQSNPEPYQTPKKEDINKQQSFVLNHPQSIRKRSQSVESQKFIKEQPRKPIISTPKQSNIEQSLLSYLGYECIILEVIEEILIEQSRKSEAKRKNTIQDTDFDINGINQEHDECYKGIQLQKIESKLKSIYEISDWHQEVKWKEDDKKEIEEEEKEDEVLMGNWYQIARNLNENQEEVIGYFKCECCDNL